MLPALLLLVLAFSTALRAADLPNIVIIFIDDMGYGDIGPFGAKGYATPNLDRMAAEGRKFTRFYVSSPVCSASRSALLTGCYNSRLGIQGAFPPRSPLGLNPSETTIAELLKTKGYATSAIGKWHLGRPPELLPTRQGFDEYLGLPYSNDMWPRHPEAKPGTFPDLPLIEGDKVIDDDVTAEDQAQLTTRYTERAVDFIRRNKERPFFLYLAHNMVHVPLFVSDKFKGKTGSLFGDVVAEVDWSVGQVLAALKDLKLDEKTLVIFTSDNGPWLSYGEHCGTSGPLREGKGTCWEGGVRVPCLMRWPGKIPSATETNEALGTIDILPTIARLVGSDLPAHKIDGRDAWPLISGQPGAKSPQETYFFYYENNELQALTSGRWKLQLPHTYRTLGDQPKAKDGIPAKYRNLKIEQPELYDLDTDIGEKTNIAADHPDEVSRLLATADTMRRDLGDSLTKTEPTGAREPGKAPPVGFKPNVVLFVCDDWGRDAGCFGNKVIQTPNIDALARDGTRFERAYCTTASCSASRSVILSGLHNHLNGQYGHQHDTGHFSAFPSVRSLPVLLFEAGWRTARIGKYHVAPEEVFKFETVLQANPRSDVGMAEKCRDLFAAKDERPFFLYICSADPHRGGGPVKGDPLAPDAFGNNASYPGITEISYDPKDVIVPPWLPDSPECRAEIAQYYRSISRVDQGIGRLVQLLKETGHYDDTLLIVTSDNGMPFPGSKTNLYEPGMHLPLVVHAPKQKTHGGTCEAMVSWADFTPTILDFCGVRVPDAPPIIGEGETGVSTRKPPPPQPYKFHGRSWAGLWDVEKPEGWDEVFGSHTFHEITMYYPMRVIETRRWKLILNVAHQLPYPFASDLWASATWQSVYKKGGSHYGGRLVADYLQRPRYELYDKQSDPQEFKNVANAPENAQVLTDLSAKLKDFQTRTRDPWVVKYTHE